MIQQEEHVQVLREERENGESVGIEGRGRTDYVRDQGLSSPYAANYSQGQQKAGGGESQTERIVENSVGTPDGVGVHGRQQDGSPSGKCANSDVCCDTVGEGNCQYAAEGRYRTNGKFTGPCDSEPDVLQPEACGKKELLPIASQLDELRERIMTQAIGDCLELAQVLKVQSIESQCESD